MKRIALKTIAVTSTFACATLLSLNWSEQGGVSLSVESAQARVGRPLTPLSGAGVARRNYRRAAYGYGAGAIGAGAVAVGTAAAVAATSPGWGWGGSPGYTGGPYYGGGRSYAGGPYSNGAWGARAYYAPPASTANAPPWNLHATYYAGGPWYNFNGWTDYKSRAGIVCDPGTVVTAENGEHVICQ